MSKIASDAVSESTAPALFLGLGRMGLPMATYLTKYGGQVYGYDPVPGQMDAFAKAGGRATDNLADVLRLARVLFIQVGKEAQVEELFRGNPGILSHCSNGTIVVQMSTVDPQFMESLTREAADRDIAVLDAPVCRGEMGAREGSLLALVAGAERAFALAEPLMRTFCSDVAYLGERAGSAQVAKAVNNLILWAAIAANYEGLRLAETWELDSEQLRQVLITSSADNWGLRNWDHVHEMPWSIKDMRIVLDIADESDVALPLSGLLSQLVRTLEVLNHA